MTNYTPSIVLSTDIPLVDTIDLVKGGLLGNANVATKALADNDAYLRDRLNSFEAMTSVTSTSGTVSGGFYVLTPSVADLQRNIYVVLSVPSSYGPQVVLPPLSAYPDNSFVTIRLIDAGAGRPMLITADGSDLIYDRNYNTYGTIYLHANEHVVMYKNAVYGHWDILQFEGNKYNVGDQFYGYYPKPGTLIRDGSVYNRADYPRLWSYIAYLAALSIGAVVSDATWNTSSGGTYPNYGKFSVGNGISTFRLPDDRGMFDRAIGDAAGLRDPDRVTSGEYSVPGSIQFDAFESHHHNVVSPASQTGGSPAGGLSPWVGTGSRDTTDVGGTETRPVNVGKVPLIIY